MNDESSTTSLVSVVVPTYNRASLLKQAIDSVLEQTYTTWELLIIDDGSTDDTREIIAKYESDARIKYFVQRNRGQAAARNVGIDKARGEFIAFLDSDNRWITDKLEQQINYLTRHPEVDVVYGDIEEIDLDGSVLGPGPGMSRHSGWVWRPLLIDNFVNFNTSIVRSRKLREVGAMDESVRRGDDYDLWLRLSTVARFHFMPGVVAQYRVAGDRISDNVAARFDSNIAAVQRFFDRNPDLLTASERKRITARIRARFARAFATQREPAQALRMAAMAVWSYPADRRNWRALAAVIYRSLTSGVHGR